MQKESQRRDNKDEGRPLYKNISLTLFVTFACERELETEQRLQHIDLTSPSGHSRVSFSSSWCSTGGPGAQLSAGFLYHISSLTHLLPNLSDFRLIWLQLTDFLSIPNYIIVQSPTQSLEWHVWSSSSGNNCHVVQRSLSSGASVYECIMEFQPCPISSAKATYAISFDYWPLECVTSFRSSLCNGMFGRSKVKIQQQAWY